MNVLELLASEPWAITENGLQIVVAVASRDEFFADVREQALAARTGAPLENARTVENRDGAAIIPIMGPLFRHANMLTRISGATSYATLRKDLHAAIEDPAIHSIVLNVDSPGGEANGCAELVNAIYEARGNKPIVAYVGGQAASAGYWIASAADRIVASETASLGSIGVIATMVKDSPDAAGKSVDFVSSQSPYKKVDLESKGDRARVQARVDDLAQVFVESVARNRGVSPQTVLDQFGQGDQMIGARAVKNHLADEIGSFEAVVAQALGRVFPASTKSNGAAGASGENMNEICKALGLSDGASEAAAVAAISSLRGELASAQEVAAAAKEKSDAAAKLAADMKAEKIAAKVDAAIEAFRLMPAEREKFISIAAKDEALFEETLSLREPKNPAEKLALSSKPKNREAAQFAAMAEYRKQHPEASQGDAYAACAEKNPALFDETADMEEV